MNARKRYADLSTQVVREVQGYSRPRVTATGHLLDKGRLFGIRLMPAGGALAFVQTCNSLTTWCHTDWTTIGEGVPVAAMTGYLLSDGEGGILWPARSAHDIWHKQAMSGAMTLDVFNRQAASQLFRSGALAGKPLDRDRFPNAWQAMEIGRTLAQHAAAVAASRKVAA